MRVTFPHMGNIHIALRSLFEMMGTEVVVPPPCSRRTLELGTRYSPESVCLPFKINVGNFIEALEEGADTIVMAGGWGPCRFGYYAQVEREILSDLGYRFNMIILEAPDSKLTSLLAQLRPLAGDSSWRQIGEAFWVAWLKVRGADRIEQAYYRFLPYARYPEEAALCYQNALKRLDEAQKPSQVNAVVEDYLLDIERAVKVARTPLRIGLVGEIYTIIEPFANFNVQERLGRLGVEVMRNLYLTEWINDHLLKGLLKVGSSKPYIALASPYVNSWVGGHGRESVGYAVGFARQGFDGVIQVGPLTCMPEIVAQAVMPQVSECEGIPVMTIYVDEQTGEAGLQTRLEAFVDMVQRRKERAGAKGGSKECLGLT